MPARATLERLQVAIYLAAIGAGAVLGRLWPAAAPAFEAALSPAVLAPALAIVLVPLAAAAFSERWIERAPAREVWRERLAWSAVPLLALVVLLIAGAQVGTLAAMLPRLAGVVPLFAAYLLAAVALAWALAKALRLRADQARTLAYSLGTRNSFVVLPLALALPAGWELAAMVIVVQSLVELLGMLAYLAWLPRVFPLPAREPRFRTAAASPATRAPRRRRP